MAIALNTSHPLYSYLTSLICVDEDGNTIIDAKGGQTLTPHANVTRPTPGTYGRSFRTNLVSNNAEGVAMSPGVKSMGATEGAGTIFVVINNGISRASRGSVFNTTSVNTALGPAVDASNHACITSQVASATIGGTTNLIGTGAHSFAVGGNSNTNGRIWVDGVLEASPTSGVGNATNALNTYIGGNASGGFGGFSADYVWIATFSKLLTDSEVASLHASLGANNAFGLVIVVANVTITATVGNAAAQGVAANVQLSGPITIGATVGNAAAQGATAAVGSFMTTDPLVNNTTHTVLANQAVYWTWTPNGRIGSMAGRTPTDGTGTTDAQGRLMTGLALAAGRLDVAVRGATTADDMVFQQYF